MKKEYISPEIEMASFDAETFLASVSDIKANDETGDNSADEYGELDPDAWF